MIAAVLIVERYKTVQPLLKGLRVADLVFARNEPLKTTKAVFNGVKDGFGVYKIRCNADAKSLW